MDKRRKLHAAIDILGELLVKDQAFSIRRKNGARQYLSRISRTILCAHWKETQHLYYHFTLSLIDDCVHEIRTNVCQAMQTDARTKFVPFRYCLGIVVRPVDITMKATSFCPIVSTRRLC